MNQLLHETIVPEELLQSLPEEEYHAAKELMLNLSKQRWRLDHLYKIISADGREIPFKMNYAQKVLYLGIWFCNLILKSRQHGITTFMCLLFLDICLFNSNTHACIIAHNREDAEDFFQKKVKYAYDNLPELIKKAIPAKLSSSKSLTFENGSSIRVTTSGRSGTYQLVHISEFGKMCAKFPAKADEVITGTLNAIHAGQLVTIESTAEGREGRFYEMCKQSRALKDLIEGRKSKEELAKGDSKLAEYLDSFEGVKLSQLQYKFFFFGWYDNPLNVVSAEGVPIPSRHAKYFNELEVEQGIRLTDEQKAWYVTKEVVQGDFMYREHPSNADEAFQASLQGTYYAVQMMNARKQNRIVTVPYQEGVLVDTWWDLGYNDINSIWMTQNINRLIHVIDYYQNSGESMLHYADYLKDLPYRYGRWVAPHDIEVHEYTTGKTRRQIAFEAGITFESAPKLSKEDQIANVRRIIPVCYFDIERCEKGLAALDAYRKEWNDKLAVYRDKPLHDWASNGADAFAIFASGHEFLWEYASTVNNLVLSEETQERERLLTKSPKGWT
jgi:hypothetical protein